jgi:hypothetical protein
MRQVFVWIPQAQMLGLKPLLANYPTELVIT